WVLAWETRLGTLYRADALAWLRELPAASAELVFADPPYNAGREAWDTFASDAEYLAWTARWVAEADRGLTPGGALYVWGFSEALADIKSMVAPRFAGCRWLIWTYRNKANLGRDWGRAHESVLHLRKAEFALNLDGARVPYNAHTLKYPAHPQAPTSRFSR